MNWLDWVFIGLCIFSLIRGFYLGLIRTLLGTLKYVLSLILILFYAPQVGEFLLKPWNLTQTIALSLKDMINLSGGVYSQPINLARLSEMLSRGDFPAGGFFSGFIHIITRLDIPQTLRGLMVSMLKQEKVIDYLRKSGDQFIGYPIKTVGDLVYYSLAGFIAKMIAVSVGSLFILIITSCVVHFIIGMFHRLLKDQITLNLANRLLGAAFNGGICFLLLIFLLELTAPLLCYFTIEPNRSVVYAVLLDSTYYIKPWLEHVLLNM